MGRGFLVARHSNRIAHFRRLGGLGSCLSESPHGVGWGFIVCLRLCPGPGMATLGECVSGHVSVW